MPDGRSRSSNIDLDFACEAWLAAAPPLAALASCAAEAARERPGGVTILFADDATVRELNARFRGKDKPTNVLSFPAPAGFHERLGDVALAYETVAAEAADQGKPLADHALHLIVHGLLHLQGYDHETEADAQEMEGEERRILARLGIADPYHLRRGA